MKLKYVRESDFKESEFEYPDFQYDVARKIINIDDKVFLEHILASECGNKLYVFAVDHSVDRLERETNGAGVYKITVERVHINSNKSAHSQE